MDSGGLIADEDVPTSSVSQLSGGVNPAMEPSGAMACIVPAWRQRMMVGALVGSALSLIMMGVGARDVFNLPAEDALWGDGCGGSPPSRDLLRNLVSRDTYDLENNQSSTSSPSSSYEYRSKNDGASCESPNQCVGFCVGGKCMLSEFAASIQNHIELWTFFDGCCLILLFLALSAILTAQRVDFPGVWRVTFCVIVMSVSGVLTTIRTR